MSTTGGGCVTLLGAGVRNAKGAFLTEPVASFFGASVTVAVVVDDDVVSGALNWTPATLVKAINEDKAATPNDVCAKGKKVWSATRYLVLFSEPRRSKCFGQTYANDSIRICQVFFNSL